MRVTSRDSFGRADRIKEYVKDGECDWCGRYTRLYKFGIWRDGLNTRPSYGRGCFCSKSCFNAYNT